MVQRREVPERAEKALLMKLFTISVFAAWRETIPDGVSRAGVDRNDIYARSSGIISR